MSRLRAHQQGDCDSGSCSFCAEEELHDLWLHEQGECLTSCPHTAEACVIEGFRCIAIEREADYLPLIVQRLTKPIQPDLFGGVA